MDDDRLMAVYGPCEVCGAARKVRNVLVIKIGGDERYTRLVCSADESHSTD